MANENGTQQAYEIIIVGAGPAGQTAALYAGRSRIPTLVLERGIPGGQLWNTAEVEDYPGFEHIMGPDLADRIQKHAEKFGATFETGAEVVSVSADGDDRVVRTADGREFRAPAVIITAGGDARKLGVPGEDELAGKGVSYCAVCDGAFFEGADIAVVGGGDSAVEEGTFLTRYGKKVSVIHRRDAYRAQPIIVEQMRATGKVDEVMNTVVDEIHGTDGRVSHLTVRNVDTDEQSRAAGERGLPVRRVHAALRHLRPGPRGPDRARRVGPHRHRPGDAHRGAGHLRRRRRALAVRAPDHQRGRRRDHRGAGRAPVRRAPEARAVEADRLGIFIP